MNTFLIEDLINLGENEFSYSKIIYSKYDLSWKIILFLMLILSFSLIGYFLIPFPSNLNNLPFFLVGGFFLYISGRYSSAKTTYVMKEYYPRYYELNKNNKEKPIIKLIRLGLLEKRLEDRGLPKNYDFNLVLNYLDYTSSSNKYGFTFSINFIVLLLGAYLGSFLSGISNIAKDLDQLNQIFKPIFGVILIALITIVYVEFVVLKDIILKFRNKNKILIETIYYYSIENQK